MTEDASGRISGPGHLQDPATAYGAFCGVSDAATRGQGTPDGGWIWSAHEFKRGRITCPECITAHAAGQPRVAEQ